MAISVTKIACASLAALAFAQCAAAQAQVSADAADAKASSDGEQLGEIIVTAQKRAQSLQDVPVAVAVLNDETLRAQRINGVDGLGSAVPNLTVTRSPFQPFIAIRGLGSGGGSRAFEQSVAMYVDGVYAGRANQFLNPFFDVERVEVVRGPQSVLFGVNANAGAINIVNKRPGTEFEGYVNAGYEFENKGYNLEGAATLPLSDTFGVRVSGRANRDGAYMYNTVKQKRDGQSDSELGRIVASWRPSSDLRFDLSYEHGHKKIDGTNFQISTLGPVPFPPAIEDGVFDFRKSTAGTPEFTKLKTDTASLNISYDVGGAVLSSSTGYSTYNFSQVVQGANHPAAIGRALDDETFKQFYQEIRLASSGKRTFDYIVGAAYYHQRSKINQGNDIDFTNFGVPGLRAAVRNGLDQRTDGYSVFGQGTLNFTEQFNVTFGGRYSSIRKKADYVISPTDYGQPTTGYAFSVPSLFILSGPPFGFFQWLNPADPTTIRPTTLSRSRTYDAFNPSLSLNYKFGNGLSAYATYTTGTKAGGFNDQEKSGLVPENGFTSDLFEYNSEKARNFEAGLKFSNGSVRANVAAFYTKYKDLQVNQPLPSGALLTTNAASATAKGLEVDVTWRAAQGLTISLDGAYLHARYDNYPGACAVGNVNCIDPLTGNARGGRLDAVPDFTGSFNVAYNVPVSAGWELRTRGRVYYNDGAQFGPEQNPFQRSPHYTLFDASIGIAQSEGGFSLTLSGKNLANKAVRAFMAPSVATAAFGYYSATLPGRQLFLDLRYDF